MILIGIFWLWCVGMSVIKIDPRQILSCGIFYSILIGPTILSNLYLASMSLDRTYMILYPTRYRLLITRRHVLIRIFLILLTIIIIMIPHHFYFYYDKKTTVFLCEFYPFIDHWRIHIWPFLHAILFVSLPSIITFVSSIVLLRNRCNHRKIHKNKLSKNARRMERNSVLILFVSIVIFFSLLPTVILEIFIVHVRLFGHGEISSARWKTYRILLNWFLAFASMNYSFKFYIRIAISKSFRNDFNLLFSCMVSRKEEKNKHHLVPLRNQDRSKNTDFWWWEFIEKGKEIQD